MSEYPIPKIRPESKQPMSKWLRVCIVIATFAFASYLMVIAFEGFFARFLADDFCYVNPALHKGLIQGFLSFYNGWTGRFSQILFTQLGVMLGPSFSSVLPSILIFSLTISQFWLFNQILQINSQTLSRVKAGLLALIVSFFFFLMNPARYQILDWLIGSITYTVPLILLVLLVTVFLRAVRHEDMVLNLITGTGIFAIAFIAAGFSETTTALQIMVLLLTFLFSIIFLGKGKKWKVVRWELITLAGTLLGFILMVLAPGNKIRQSLLPIPPGFLEIFSLSFQYSFAFIGNLVRTMPIPVVVLFFSCLLIGLLLSWNKDKTAEPPIRIPMIWNFILIPIVTIILIASICAPTIFAYSSYLEPRAQTLGIYICIITIVLLGFQTGNKLSSLRILSNRKMGKWFELIAFGLLLLASIYPVRASINFIPEIQETMKFAQSWDSRAEIIHQSIAQKKFDVVVPAINSQHGIQEVTQDPNNWVNKCVAEYYGLNSLIAH